MGIYGIGRLVFPLIYFLLSTAVMAKRHGDESSDDSHLGPTGSDPRDSRTRRQPPGKLDVTCELTLGVDDTIESMKCSKILLSCEPKLGTNTSPRQLLCSVVKGRNDGRHGRGKVTTTLPTSTALIPSTSPTADGPLAMPESSAASPTWPCWSLWWLLPGLVAIGAPALIAGVWIWRIRRRRQLRTAIRPRREVGSGIEDGEDDDGRYSQSPQQAPRKPPRMNPIAANLSSGYIEWPRPLALQAAGRPAATIRPTRHRVAAVERAAPSSPSSSTNHSGYPFHVAALRAVQRRMRTGEEYSAGSLEHIRRQKRGGRAVMSSGIESGGPGFAGRNVALGQQHPVSVDRRQPAVASVASGVPLFQQHQAGITEREPPFARGLHQNQLPRANVIKEGRGQLPVVSEAHGVHLGEPLHAIPREQLFMAHAAGGVPYGQQHLTGVIGGQPQLASVAGRAPAGQQQQAIPRVQPPGAGVAGEVPYSQQHRTGVIGGQPQLASVAGRAPAGQQQQAIPRVQPPGAGVAGEVPFGQQHRTGMIGGQPQLASVGSRAPASQQQQAIPRVQPPGASGAGGATLGQQHRAYNFFARDYILRTSACPNNVPSPSNNYRFD